MFLKFNIISKSLTSWSIFWHLWNALWVPLFPGSPAPPWCHQIPKKAEREQRIFGNSCYSNRKTRLTSLTLCPGGPTGPVGPSYPSSPRGPRRPFSPRLPGGPGDPCSQRMKPLAGLSEEDMNSQVSGSNPPGPPWIPDRPFVLAQLWSPGETVT